MAELSQTRALLHRLKPRAGRRTGLWVTSREGFWIAFEALRTHKLRSFLTLLGVVIATTTLIVVMSIINGMNLYIADHIANLGANVFIVHQYKWAQGYEEWLKARRRNQPIRIDDFEFLRDNLKGYKNIGAEAYMGNTDTNEVRYKGKTVYEVQIAGETPNMVDIGQMKVGRRLAIKLLNASKFVLGIGGLDNGVTPGAVTEAIDRAMLAELDLTLKAATTWFEAYEYARALEQAEAFFWNFCDNYLELVKDRAYGETLVPGIASARAALRIALSAVIRLFAPFLPFVTEEVWSWWQDGSVHRAGWPDAAGLRAAASCPASEAALDAASAAIAAVRKAKSQARLPMRASVHKLLVSAPAAELDAIAAMQRDIMAAGRIAEIELRRADLAAPAHEVLL